ncbi:DMT family transporter [Mycolicibacterium hippocampi]|uniref:Multidrug resistance protein Mmr n=1 Tax=Mycolicibacterium hippocampi TaxID=659824 RepID=A0A7I9ZN05_9MYCO|nr:multidrug efflux SMR transporter [Mycolicibacterium hippocampi]GFH02411.1 putative multidrug resistance protein [Mycolicibacterium hippocampi]
MAWLLLVVAGLLEVFWATALKQAEGFTRLWPTVFGLTGAMVSLLLLGVALRSLPAGTGYAAWVGIGTVGVVLVGAAAFGESLTVGRAVFLVMIVAGIVGLRLVEG